MPRAIILATAIVCLSPTRTEASCLSEELLCPVPRCGDCAYPRNMVVRLRHCCGPVPPFVCVERLSRIHPTIGRSVLARLNSYEHWVGNYYEYALDDLLAADSDYQVLIPYLDAASDCSSTDSLGPSLGGPKTFRVNADIDVDEVAAPPFVNSVRIVVFASGRECVPPVAILQDLTAPATHTDPRTGQFDAFGREDGATELRYLGLTNLPFVPDYESGFYMGFPWENYVQQPDDLLGRTFYVAFQYVDPAGHRSPMSPEVKVTVEQEGCSCGSAGRDPLWWLGALAVTYLLAKRKMGGSRCA
jgi:MYXO-CTERM domain-containing protein